MQNGSDYHRTKRRGEEKEEIKIKIKIKILRGFRLF